MKLRNSEVILRYYKYNLCSERMWRTWVVKVMLWADVSDRARCQVNVFITAVSLCIHLVSPVIAAPSDRHAAHKYQPGLPADRVLWAVRPWFQLHEDWHQSEEWRGLPVQGGHAEGHGKWKQTINALHRGSHTAWWDGDYGIHFPVGSAVFEYLSWFILDRKRCGTQLVRHSPGQAGVWLCLHGAQSWCVSSLTCLSQQRVRQVVLFTFIKSRSGRLLLPPPF